MLAALRVYVPPDGVLVANDLRREYRELPAWRRLRLARKSLQRELLMRVSGAARLRVDRVPPAARRMLWIYSWTTIGDSLMDLAVRERIARHLTIDLCVAAPLVPLYAGDPHFARVCVPESLPALRTRYDFVLLQDFSTRNLRRWRDVGGWPPFASMLGHLQGEHFDRIGLAQRRAEQLFGWPAAAPALPRLHLDGARGGRMQPHFQLAVALGARDPRRSGPDWAAVLEALRLRWPAAWPAPRFLLLGSANARADLVRFDPAWLARHAQVEIDRHDLRSTATLLRDADAFLGMDGGLMHVAAALDRPGLAIFSGIDPALRLHPQARLRALYTPHHASSLDPAQVADAWLAAAWPTCAG